MKRRILAPIAALLLPLAALALLLGLLSRPNLARSGVAWAAPAAPDPTVAEISPTSGPNDLDTQIVITGTDFDAGATVRLGDTTLEDAGWVNSTTLTATVPWGMDPGVYPLRVENPDGGSASLTDAFTVTEAIDVWNATELYGGNVNEVVINPQAPETVYAVSDDVGMFRSEDGAGSWTFQVSGGEYSVRNLALDPVSPTVAYMVMPGGLHRSDDGGDTWVPLGTPGQIPFPHPTDSGTLFASNRWEGESGLWKSTDYGESWLDVTEGMTDTRVRGLVFDPTDPMTIYAGTEQGNVFVSSNGGTSWAFVDQPLGYIQALAINPRGDHELWVSNCCFCQPNTTLRSTNASHTTWLTVSAPVGSMPLTSIEFAPDAWGAAYTQTLFVSDCWDEVQASGDNGASWTSLDPEEGKANSGLALHPGDPNVLYATSGQQGIYKTTDGGASWQVANEGLTALVPDQLATVKGQAETLYAVTDIGLLKGTQGGATWQSLSVGGDAHGFVATDPFTPDRVYLAGGDVGMGQDLPIFISEDGGETWPITSYLTEPSRYDQYAHLDPLIAPDPSQPGVLLAGVRHAVIEPGGAEAGSVYRSADAGQTWAEVDVGDVISPVKDIAFDVVSPTLVYLAASGSWSASGSGLYRSADGGLTWERVGAAIPGMDRAESIAVEPSAPHRVVVRTGWPDLAIYVSEDHGVSWTRVSGIGGDWGDLLYTHGDPPALYAASGNGLFRSADAGQSWSRANGVLGQLPIYSLATVTDTDRVFLYAGTTGGTVAGASQALGAAAVAPAADGTLVNAGVYRYTSRNVRVYLPLVIRAPALK